MKVAPGAYKAMLGLEESLHQCGLEESLLHLVKLRPSQINGCAYCIDMHWKDLRAIGESEQRLYGLDAGKGLPITAIRERAVFAWTEAVTNLQDGHVSNEVYETVRQHLSAKRTGRSDRSSSDHECLESPGNLRANRSRNLPASPRTSKDERLINLLKKQSRTRHSLRAMPLLLPAF
ncbi:MAG TPA: carboxymuconolactone decarboxylase family protein [Terriglobales bacterium]|jgi:AhpD family alkylhydroperoxidase|nr:carboxymuconolactone decarboxylase family protein [Terriglobales bacterium]